MCVSETFLLLNREVELYQYSPGFPEFSVRISQRLRKFSKETRSARWRAYSKGCLELCSKYYQRAVQERAKLNDVAPRDVKQLELLKPIKIPAMGERLKQLLEKEKRLEAASRPLQKTNEVKEKSKEDGEEKKKTKKRKRSKKKKSTPMIDVPENALEEEDEVQEGIDWSDDE